jgi:tetratricopeptide (TPR) repeat protein
VELSELASLSAVALKKNNWKDLELLSTELLKKIRTDPRMHENDLRRVARNYIASIIGEGLFITGSDASGQDHFENGIKTLQKLINSSNNEIISKLRPEIRHLQQIQLFITAPQTDSLNKASASLRKLGRPQLAIELTNSEVQKSRLNYYSLVVRGSAYVDLKLHELAIKDGELALKHSPGEKKRYALTLLARATNGLFKVNGVLDDGEQALSYALKSLEIKRDPYIASVFISIVRALGTSDYDELIAELNSTLVFDFDKGDPVALEISTSIIQKTNFETSIQDDPWGIDYEEVEEDLEASDFDDEDSISDYFEDYFEEYSDSLADPQRPHLEP